MPWSKRTNKFMREIHSGGQRLTPKNVYKNSTKSSKNIPESKIYLLNIFNNLNSYFLDIGKNVAEILLDGHGGYLLVS